MNADLTTIHHTRLFECVDEDVIQRYIVPRGNTLTIAQRESLFKPLDRVNTIYILLSGKVKLVYYMENGDQDIRNMMLPGNLVGIDLICTRTQFSPYQATAVENSRLFSFSSDILLNPGVLPESDRLTCLRNLLLILSHVNMQNEYRLAILTRNSLRERILVYLTMQASRNRSETFTIPFSREEMASYLRVNRSALSHELSLLRQEGIIDFSKNEFSLLSQNSACFDIVAY